MNLRPIADPSTLFAKRNLVAWCIVPFDAKKRSPKERAEMLTRLGISKLAYDYRAEHIPTFDDEITTMKQAKIDLVAWWFPTVLNDEAKLILKKIGQHQIKPQLWVMGGGEPTKTPAEQEARIASECQRLTPIALAAKKLNLQVGLYNHGAWFGEPANMVALCQRLNARPELNSADGKPTVGIVYNLHHAHDQMDKLDENLQAMLPYLITLNLNGMDKQGDRHGRKILPIGAGNQDTVWLKSLIKSDYRGPLGILNHTDLDAETRLKENLTGLARLTATGA